MDRFVNWDAQFAGDPVNYFWFLIVLLGIGEFTVAALNGLYKVLSWLMDALESHVNY